MSEDNYKEDIAVDFFNLHLNYRDQASNLMKWGEKWVNAVRERDKRKRFLRINIKNNPAEYGLPRNPSKAAVDAEMEADDKLIELNADVNTYQTAMKAFDHRQRALDGLIKLYLNGYFSGPHPSTTMIKEIVREEEIQSLRAEQLEGIQKSKRRIGRRKHGDEQTSSDSEEPEGGSTEETH